MERSPCRNPECKNTVFNYKRKNNKSGKQEYCGLSCYSIASPRVLDLYGRYHDLGTFTKENFKRFLEKIYKEYNSSMAMSTALGISRSTLSSWFSKFEVKIEKVPSFKTVRNMKVLKYRDVVAGDVIVRLSDQNEKKFRVLEKRDGEVMISYGNKKIPLRSRMLKFWKKV